MRRITDYELRGVDDIPQAKRQKANSLILKANIRKHPLLNNVLTTKVDQTLPYGKT